jgi:hypothetical protein
MNTFIKGVLPVVAAALAFPAASFAQSSDAAYCKALVAKYDQYLGQDTKTGWYQPQNVAAKDGVEKCKVGDTSGIPAIEKALTDAKFNLPPRG